MNTNKIDFHGRNFAIKSQISHKYIDIVVNMIVTGHMNIIHVPLHISSFHI